MLRGKTLLDDEKAAIDDIETSFAVRFDRISLIDPFFLCVGPGNVVRGRGVALRLRPPLPRNQYGTVQTNRRRLPCIPFDQNLLYYCFKSLQSAEGVSLRALRGTALEVSSRFCGLLQPTREIKMVQERRNFRSEPLLT
ncbi:MAG: hypothetical protein MPW15_21855 [Candidatus Manganitrophus sp.]|nr:hypothetical protein [Candidatus Manganitrophus sp.]